MQYIKKGNPQNQFTFTPPCGVIRVKSTSTPAIQRLLLEFGDTFVTQLADCHADSVLLTTLSTSRLVELGLAELRTSWPSALVRALTYGRDQELWSNR